MENDTVQDYLGYMCLIGVAALYGSEIFEKYKEVWEREVHQRELDTCTCDDEDVKVVVASLRAYLRMVEKVYLEAKTLRKSQELMKLKV